MAVEVRRLVRGARPVVPLFAAHVLQKARQLGVIIRDRHPGRGERVQDREVELGYRPVPPPPPARVRGQAQLPGYLRKLVVAAGVAEVTGTDLSAHVPAVERRGRVPHAADVQVHVADHRHGVPAQAEVSEPGEIRMPDHHLEHRVGGQLVQRGEAAAFLHDQRENVEAARRPAAGPAEMTGKAGDIHVRRVPDDGAVRGLMARVPHQLGVDDARAGQVRPVRREHGDHGADLAPVRRLTQVSGALGRDGRRRGDLAAVAHLQAVPVRAADAPGAVPPRGTGTEGQLLRGMPVGPGLVDLAVDTPEPLEGRARVTLGVEQRDDLPGARVQVGLAAARQGPRRGTVLVQRHRDLARKQSTSRFLVPHVMAPSGARWTGFLAETTEPGCAEYPDAYIADSLTPALQPRSMGQRGVAPGPDTRPRALRSAAPERRVGGVQAYPGGFGFRHAEPFEDVKCLPENDPGGVRSLRAERRFRYSLEELGLFVWVADLARQPQSGAVMLPRLVVPARPAVHVGYPAQRHHLLGQVPDLRGDQPGPLVVNQRLVIASRALENAADVNENVGFIGKIPDAAVYGQRPPVGGKGLFAIALVMVNAANALIQDRLTLGGAYLIEYFQGLLVVLERVPMLAGVQVHLSQVVEALSLATPFTDLAVQGKRVKHVLHCVREAPEVPAGDPGMAQRFGHAVPVPGLVVQGLRFLKIGEGLTGTSRPLVRQTHLVQGFGLAAAVAQRPVDRHGIPGQPERGRVLADLLLHDTELERCPRDPGRVGDVATGLQGERVGLDRLVQVRPDFHEARAHWSDIGGQ